MRERPEWSSTPEEFLEMILFLYGPKEDQSLKEQMATAEFDAVANAFMKEFDVDISPYTSFQDLKERAILTGSFSRRMIEALHGIQESVTLEEALAERDIGLSNETRAKEFVDDQFTRAMITKLRRRIKFKDDEP